MFDRITGKANWPNVHCTQTLWSTIEHQFRISMQQLKGKAFVKIIDVTLKSMDRFKNLWKKYIDEQWRDEFEDEYICGILNSAKVVSIKLGKIYEQILKSINEYEIDIHQQHILNDCFNNKMTLFVNISNECSIKLSQRIYEDTLEENIFEVLFTDEHFGDDDDLTASMIETLKDYFGDLKVWIEEDTLFWQVVTSTIVVIVNHYLHALISAKPDIDTRTLAKKIDDDVDALNNYFGCDEDLIFCRILWSIKYKYLTALVSALGCESQEFKTHANIIANDQSYGKKLLTLIKQQRQRYIDSNI